MEALDSLRQEHSQREYVGFWERVGAAVIDFMILLPITGLAYYNGLSLKSITLAMVLIVLQASYKPILEYTQGATFGKKALKAKVINENGGKITLGQALLRCFYQLLYVPLTIYSTYLILNSTIEEMIENSQGINPSMILQLIVGIITIACVIMVGIDKRKQGLHDMLAKTFVVRDRS